MAGAGKEASPLNYAKLGATMDAPLDVDAMETAPPQYPKSLGPTPTGRNRLEEQPAKEKKSKKREDATQGFEVTSSVAPAKKAKKREQSGEQMFFIRK